MTTEPRIETLEQLEAIVGKDKGLWFLALIDAEACVEDFRLKDWAGIFINGLPPMSERWQDMLLTLAELDENDEEQYPTEQEIRDLMVHRGW